MKGRSVEWLPEAGGEAERWGGDDHGLNMWFGGPGTSGNIRAEVRIDYGMCRGLAPVMIRVRPAIGADFRKVWDPARGHEHEHEHGEADIREAECADAGCIQPS